VCATAAEIAAAVAPDLSGRSSACRTAVVLIAQCLAATPGVQSTDEKKAHFAVRFFHRVSPFGDITLPE
jgi:hypothetical protein